MQTQVVLAFNYLIIVTAVWGTTGIIPTSVAVKEAEKIASDMGYKMPDKSVFFDQAPGDGRFITIDMYRHEHIIYRFAINQDTGQIVDPTRCLLFDTTSAQAFERYQQRLTGHPPFAVRELARSVGCDVLRLASRRRAGGR